MDLPYTTHIGSVAMEVIAALTIETIPTPDLAVQCALLHDVLEDTAVTYDQLQTEFGAAVAAGVLALSKDPNLPTSRQMADSLARIQRQPSAVWVVKLADRISNLQSPPAHWSPAKIRGYREEALKIHQALHLASPLLADRLATKIEAYRAFCPE